MVRRAVTAAAVVLGAWCAGPAAAVAHPLLVTAAPAPGAILPGAPSSLTLAFSEPAIPRGSAVRVSGPGGRLALGALHSAGSQQQLVATLPRRLVPGVYRVHWVALGQDGHAVSGDFAFAVAEANGAPPPGASGLAGVGGGRGGDAAGEGPVSVALRWLGILAASLLWGGSLLPAVVRRRDPGAAAAAARRLAVPLGAALATACGSALYGLFQQAGSGAGSGLDLGLLTASGTGISALVRVAIAIGAAVAFLAVRRGRRTLAALAGLGLLASYGLSGHVLAQGNAPAAFAMVVHVVAAGTWAGGLIGLVVLVGSGELRLPEAARGFAPIAATAVGLAVATGVIVAVREVSHWYFLWWSGYGRLVIVKVLVVAAASAAGAMLAWRSRRAAGSRPIRRARLLGAEMGLVAAALAIAVTLSGLAQGRGQPLPAQRGDLLPGPAFAGVLLHQGPAPVGLAPALPGTNTIVVIPPARARSVQVRLVCGCDVRPVIAVLHQGSGSGSGGAFSAAIPVPDAGSWNAYVAVDGVPAATPVTLDVGVHGAPGAPVRSLLAIADLSGPGAARCRAYLVGLELAIGRLNGSGGVDGGDKLALLALDDGGSPVQAAAVADRVLSSGSGSRAPVAVLPCGAGAEPAVALAGRAGVPTIAGDPATGPVGGPDVFRVAGDPYADGVAIGQALAADIVPVSAPGARQVRVVSVPDAQGARRLAGLRSALPAGLRLVPTSTAAVIGSSPEALTRLLDRRATVALVLDATDSQAPSLAAAIRRLHARRGAFAPAPIVASERVLSEAFITAAGDPGRIGVIQGTSTVAIQSRDALTLSQAIPALFAGQRASLEGLRGYVAGLALDDGLQGGTSPAAIVARLTRPLPFTDAIAQPWRADAPAAGGQRLGILEPTFLSSTLVPASQGGESYSGQYFSDGAWMRPTSTFYGPPLERPVAPLGGS